MDSELACGFKAVVVGRLESHHVRCGCKCHQAFELVVAIGAPTKNPQRQIYLGRSPFR